MRLPLAAMLAALALAAPAVAQDTAPPAGVTPDMTLVAPPPAVVEGMEASGGTAAAEIAARPAPEGASAASQTAAAAGGTPDVQPQAQQEAADAATGDAPAATVAEPATPPSSQQAAGTVDGTAPSASGSTGWSGGTGGSMIGTNPSGAVTTSKTWQPPTARGLDLMMGAADAG